jgi:ribosomal protein L10
MWRFKMEEGKKVHLAKEKSVKLLADKITKAKTLMIVSIKGLPSKQFQEIKKSIRDHALVRVAKKNIMLRAIKAIGKDSITPLEKYIQENCAFAISDIEGFELAGILSKKKTPVFAKAGQTATEDIEVKEGPTELVPGPAISELGSLGLQVSVEDGKIAIKKTKVVIREGQAINETAASIFQKLNIQPFSVGLEPLVIYDVETEKIYTDIKIDTEETISQLKLAASKALGFAQRIVYYCKETIGFFLAKANAEAEALEKFEAGDTGNTSKDNDEQKSEESEKVKEDVGNASKDDDEQKSSESEGDKTVESKPKEDNKEPQNNSQLNNPEENK